MSFARLCRAVGRTAAIGLECLAITAVAAWLLGRVFSDRHLWSQWLLWIPTPAAMLAGGLGLAAAARSGPSRRARLIAWGAACAVLVAYFALIEHRFLRAAPANAGAQRLRLVHASIQETWPNVRPLYERELERLGADVTIISIAVPIDQVWRLAEEVPPAGRPVVAWPFLMLSRLPILEARPLVADDMIFVAVFRLDATATLGRPITVYAVDLPSAPRISRAAIARRTRALLEGVQAAPPDVVVGDFNMTRGSAAISILFPGMEHAFDQAGTGYGATFHRAFPLYHIDHALLGPGLRAAGYELYDPGLGRHRFQVVELQARSAER